MRRISQYPSEREMLAAFGCASNFDDNRMIFRYMFSDDHGNEAVVSFSGVDASFKFVAKLGDVPIIEFYSEYTNSISIVDDSALHVEFLFGNVQQYADISVWPHWRLNVVSLNQS